ncbi:MAG: glycosyltransferase family 2 protein [Thermoguttaceae bacterium]|nr:glycosyltransferase family 2 protein [Thermoguttaceae bacterium]
MRDYLFSIIVPVYKVETYLRQCVESLLNQTYPNIEIILVDDGSPDSCPQICDEYAAKDRRVKVIHKENGGLVSARRAGAKAVSGEYVLCVDGDDWVKEDYVEKFAAAIAEHDAPDMVMSGSVRAYEDREVERELPYRKGFYSQSEIAAEFFPFLLQSVDARYFAPSVWAKAYRAELYCPAQESVDEKIKIGEDSACVVPCVYRAASLVTLPYCGYYYRQNPASMTKNKRAFPWNGPELMHRHFASRLDLAERDFEAQLYRKTTHELFLVAVSQFYRKEPYRVVAADVRKNLTNPIYREAVLKSRFAGFKAKAMRWALKYRWTRVMQLWAKIKK